MSQVLRSQRTGKATIVNSDVLRDPPGAGTALTEASMGALRGRAGVCCQRGEKGCPPPSIPNMTSVRPALLGRFDAPPLHVEGDGVRASNPSPDGTELDDAALEAIFKGYGLLSFRDGATADDVLHEVILRLLRKGGSFVALESEAQRRLWLYRTTLRVCWDIKARSKRELGRAEEVANTGPTMRCGGSGLKES